MNNKRVIFLPILLGSILLSAMPLLAQSPPTPVSGSVPVSDLPLPFRADSHLLRQIDFSAANSASRFEKIQLQHYDAAMMADLITRPNGIIVVPPNFVFPGSSTNNGVFTGRQNAPMPTAVQSSASPTAAPAAVTAPVLPSGISRIYAMESDNSLVIERNNP